MSLRLIFGNPHSDPIDKDVREDTLRHHIQEMKSLRHQIKKIETTPRPSHSLKEVHTDLCNMYRYHDSASRILLSEPDAIWILR